MIEFKQVWDPAYLGAEGFPGELNDAPFIAGTDDFSLVIDSSGIQLDIFVNDDVETYGLNTEFNYEKAKNMVAFIENLMPGNLELFFSTFNLIS